MNLRQKLAAKAYPLAKMTGKLTGYNADILSSGTKAPDDGFYNLTAELNSGDILDFSTLKGKKVVIINTASDCGYTEQYSELQKLHTQRGGELHLLGFPANDFKGQEPGSDDDIRQFCEVNFGVTFPLMKKSVVLKKSAQHPVFRWLTTPSKNGWNRKQPLWNFTKYVIDEAGNLTHYFGPAVSPLDSRFIDAVK
jgi:glutathione peroxidase